MLLLYLADRFANRDHRWRRTLSEAVFPFYLIHEPVIVLTGAAIVPRGMGAGVEFAIVLAATLLACTLFYFGGRRVGWLRPLIGLGPRGAARGTPIQARAAV